MAASARPNMGEQRQRPQGAFLPALHHSCHSWSSSATMGVSAPCVLWKASTQPSTHAPVAGSLSTCGAASATLASSAATGLGVAGPAPTGGVAPGVGTSADGWRAATGGAGETAASVEARGSTGCRTSAIARLTSDCQSWAFSISAMRGSVNSGACFFAYALRHRDREPGEGHASHCNAFPGPLWALPAVDVVVFCCRHCRLAHREAR